MAQKTVERVNTVYEQARRDYVNSIADLSSRPLNVPYLYSGRVLENLRPLVTDMVPSIQHTAAIALSRMAAQNEKIAVELLNENFIFPLLRNLNCKSKIYKRAALYVLRSVSRHSSELAEKLVQCGALEAIILCLEDFDPKVREASCWATEYIARHSPELAEAVVDAATVPMLMVCLREPELSLKTAAAAAVCAICRHSLDLAQVCVDATAVFCLAACARNSDFRLKRQVFLALSEIAKHSPELAELVVEAEILPDVLMQMAHADDLTRRNAAILVRELVKHSVELAEFVVNSGGVAALVDMVEKTKGATRLPAIMALGYIGAQMDQLASVIISSKGMHQLAVTLCEEKEDHILAATVWAIGQVGKHSPEHAKAAALANVFTKMVKLYCSKSSSEDLRQKTKHSLKMVLQKCTHLSALETLLVEAPLSILKYVLGQFSKVLPHDSRARRLFVTTGGLRKVQQLVVEPGTPLHDYKTIINLCFPEEIVKKRRAKLSPQQRDFLADFMEANLDFARGKFSGPNGKWVSIRMWAKFAEMANLMGPPKDIPHWQKAWTDTRCRLRAKVAAIKAARQKSVSADSIPVLSTSERKIQAIIDKDIWQGESVNDTLIEDHESFVMIMDDDEVSPLEIQESLGGCDSAEVPLELVTGPEGDIDGNKSNEGSTTSGIPPESLAGKKRKSSSQSITDRAPKTSSFRQDLEESWCGLYKLQEEQNKTSKTVSEALNKMSSTMLMNASVEEKRNALLERLCKAVEGLVEVMQSKNHPYYSPAYSESLLKRLEVFEPKIPPEVLLADRATSPDRQQVEVRCPYYEEPQENEDQLPEPNLPMDDGIEPWEDETGSLKMEEVHAEGPSPELSDWGVNKTSKEAMVSRRKSPLEGIQSEGMTVAIANPEDKSGDPWANINSAPAAVEIPLTEIGKRTPASEAPSEI